CPSQKGLVDRIPDSVKKMENQAKNITVPRIMNMLKLLTDLKYQLTWDTQWHIQTEITFLRMCHRSADRSPEVIEERLAELEEKIRRLPEIIHTNQVFQETAGEISEVKKLETARASKQVLQETAEKITEEAPKKNIITEVSAPAIPDAVLPVTEPYKETVPVEEPWEPEEEISPSLPVPDEEIFASAMEEETPYVPPPAIEEKAQKEIDFHIIKKRWEDFLYRFKGENIPIYQPLIQGELTELKGNILTLSFTHSFYRDRIEDNKSKIENSLERFFGKQILLKTKLVEKKVQEISLFGEENNVPKKQPGKKEVEGPTIDEVTKLFEGEIII
ncbi:MAG: hypothetical protein ABRQ37_13140, partial [Candidatus Eremiobacterota bacterium]